MLQTTNLAWKLAITQNENQITMTVGKFLQSVSQDNFMSAADKCKVQSD